MKLGWVDFSRKGFNIVRSIRSIKSDKGRNELGITYLQKGYAGLFFPGFSTLINRSRYCFLVPAALLQLGEEFPEMKKKAAEEKTELDEAALGRRLREIEFLQCKALLRGSEDSSGIIGKANTDKPIQSTPATKFDYLGFLRKYGVFTLPKGEYDKYREYLRIMLSGEDMTRYWNFEGLRGAEDCGSFLDKYRVNEESRFNMKLDREETDFLRSIIKNSGQDSLLKWLMFVPLDMLDPIFWSESEKDERKNHDKFRGLSDLAERPGLPRFEEIRSLKRATAISRLSEVLYTAYNLMVLKDGMKDCEKAARLWNSFDLGAIAQEVKNCDALENLNEDIKRADDGFLESVVEVMLETDMSETGGELDERLTAMLDRAKRRGLKDWPWARSLMIHIYWQLRSDKAKMDSDGWREYEAFDYYAANVALFMKDFYREETAQGGDSNG